MSVDYYSLLQLVDELVSAPYAAAISRQGKARQDFICRAPFKQ